MNVFSSKATVEMLPFVGKKRTPELASSVTEGIEISSTSGGLFELEVSFAGLASSLSCEEKKYSTGCFKIENPGSLERIVHGNFRMSFTGPDTNTYNNIN